MASRYHKRTSNGPDLAKAPLLTDLSAALSARLSSNNRASARSLDEHLFSHRARVSSLGGPRLMFFDAKPPQARRGPASAAVSPLPSACHFAGDCYPSWHGRMDIEDGHTAETARCREEGFAWGDAETVSIMGRAKLRAGQLLAPPREHCSRGALCAKRTWARARSPIKSRVSLSPYRGPLRSL